MSCPQPFDPWFGSWIGDRQRYLVTEPIGSGAMGDVFLATDTLLGQSVALKVLSAKLAAGAMRKRFEREVAVCAALRSDHIVQVMDYGVTPEGYPFYVMEYLRGQTLRQLLWQEGRLCIERAIKIVTQICSGLHLAHQGIDLWDKEATSREHVKVVHRDLKPENIFLVSTALGECVKILDFGIAKICNDQAEYTNATNVFLGTLKYAAPEQFQLKKDLDHRADIYSLGMILYEMLSGTDPFGLSGEHLSEPPSLMAWAMAHTTQPPSPLREQPDCEQLPEELEAVVMQCLEKLPEQRPTSVMELNQALYTVLAHDRRSAVGQNAETKTNWVNPQIFSLQEHTGPTELTGLNPEITHPVTQNVAPFLKQVSLHSAVPVNLRKSALLAVAIGTVAFALGFRMLSIQTAGFSIPPELLSFGKSESALQPSAKTEEPTPQPLESAAVMSLSEQQGEVWTVGVSPDGTTLASAGSGSTVKLYDFQTGELLRVLTGHSDTVRAVAFGQSEPILASGSGDKTIKLWNFQTGELLQSFSTDSGTVWSVAISPDEQTLASGSYDGAIRIWNLQTGELRQILPEHYDSIWSIAFSPDGKTLASGSYDGTIKIWDLQTGELLRTLSGHIESVRAIAISPDGQTLVSGSWDKTIKVWNFQTGELLHTLTGHSDRVLSVAISATQNAIASGSIDRTIKIWDLQTGDLLRTLPGHSHWVISVAFSPDGKTLVSGSKDETVKFWQW